VAVRCRREKAAAPAIDGTVPALGLGIKRAWLPLHLLVEQALGLGLCQGVPVGYGVREPVVLRRWPACRGNRRRLGRLADVGENPPYRSGVGDEGDGARVGAAVEADQ
jgi:hypothetical protein